MGTFEDCVERLATAIRLGVYPYGSMLPPERELAAELGVSRATLREAIAALRSARMVSTVRGRGGGTVVEQKPTAPRADPGAFAGRGGEVCGLIHGDPPSNYQGRAPQAKTLRHNETTRPARKCQAGR